MPVFRIYLTQRRCNDYLIWHICDKHAIGDALLDRKCCLHVFCSFDFTPTLMHVRLGGKVSRVYAFDGNHYSYHA